MTPAGRRAGEEGSVSQFPTPAGRSAVRSFVFPLTFFLPRHGVGRFADAALEPLAAPEEKKSKTCTTQTPAHSQLNYNFLVGTKRLQHGFRFSHFVGGGMHAVFFRRRSPFAVSV